MTAKRHTKYQPLQAICVICMLSLMLYTDFAVGGLLDKVKEAGSSLPGATPGKGSGNVPPQQEEQIIKQLKVDPLPANSIIALIKDNKDLDFNNLFKKEITGKDKILYLLEHGRAAQIIGKYDISKASFESAINAIKENDEKAMITARDAGSQLSAILVNDKEIPYKGDGFERVLLRHFQALNYLALGNLEAAAVEVRNANFEQEEVLKKHEKEVDNALAVAKEKNVVAPEDNTNISTAFSKLDEIAGKVKSSFQNAYTFYMSGVIREILNEPNDAYIDYKKALEIVPDNVYVQKDVIRLATMLEMADDLEKFKNKYPSITVDDKSASSQSGELIIFFEDGLVPQKEGISVPIPFVGGMTAVAFPFYNFEWNDPQPLIVSATDTDIGHTQPICLIGALAVKSLKEKIPTLVLRQAIRSTVKGVATKAATDKFGKLGGVAASAYNVLTEQPDTRCWITLPDNVQILRATLPEGDHTLTLSHARGGPSTRASVAIQSGKKTILRVIRIGNRLISQQLWPAT